ncbi:hypothetical protein BGZ61DRAFT_398449 [Ilyonectria robusta]|uniref:uncharacterized protein n=1 Tax=Ilyonectria robusta TaxID=1079257 RepID=UPI001E8D8155|nr:uncharacterized protein BGZ61DRAFT_398449 [Ilyonectria robusta]KAH8672411.1 hypothetical protein BGZ61DRAFT_398449 [Ilyonectria robusta]
MDPSVSRRRRVERGKRSKTGCRTCIKKRVKCDELHPECGRCVRLKLRCEWAPQQPSLALRRRGQGPIKDRDGWTPEVILPKPAGDEMPQETGDAAVPLSSCADIPASTQLNHGLEPEFFDINQPLDESGVMAAMDIGAALVSPHFGLSETITSMMLMDSSTGLTPNLANSDDWAIDANRQQHIYNTLQFPMSNPFNPFNSANYPTATTALFFANAIGAEYAPSNGTSDMQAVSFHRVVFAPLKSTRTPAVSAHALFLNRALENCMALHFLLAVSHSELAIHQGAGVETPQESWTHFQRGSKLFLQALDPLSQPDHVAMMLSFLYMYMFWMRRSPLNVQKLRELSDSVLAYVKSYNLDELCASASVSASPHSPTSDQVLIARILTYLYDRDGFCDFFGCGGAFASYVSQNHEKRHRIWRLSRTTFPGTDEIPTTLGLSQVPKIPDSAVLSVYFDLIAIHHDINCYSQAPEDQTLAARVKIKRSLDRIQEEQAFISQLVADSERQGSSPFLMALVTVTFFHALQIYFYRSRNSHFGQRPVPSEIQWALRELVAAAYYTMATGPVQLLERFQWSLLIAGIETHDPVHLEWISRTISDPSMKHALHLVQEAKAISYISMQTLRQIIEGCSSAGV